MSEILKVVAFRTRESIPSGSRYLYTKTFREESDEEEYSPGGYPLGPRWVEYVDYHYYEVPGSKP